MEVQSSQSVTRYFLAELGVNPKSSPHRLWEFIGAGCSVVMFSESM